MRGLQVLYEDNHLIAVNKPAGMLVQGDQTNDKPLSDYVKAYIKARYNKPGDVFLGTIHRIDRPVSGLVIFARTSKALTRMNKLFQEREIKKTYWALTDARPEPFKGHLENYIAKDSSRNKAKVLMGPSRRHPDAKIGVLDYELIGELSNRYMVEVKPKTGRPHQIRVQLANIGCPIMGDIKYGSSWAANDGNIFLHSRALEFIHPVKKEPVRILADPPENREWATLEDVWSAFN